MLGFSSTLNDSFLSFSSFSGAFANNQSSIKAKQGVIENKIIGIGALSSDSGKERIVNVLAVNWVILKANARKRGGKYSVVM